MENIKNLLIICWYSVISFRGTCNIIAIRQIFTCFKKLCLTGINAECDIAPHITITITMKEFTCTYCDMFILLDLQWTENQTAYLKTCCMDNEEKTMNKSEAESIIEEMPLLFRNRSWTAVKNKVSFSLFYSVIRVGMIVLVFS